MLPCQQGGRGTQGHGRGHSQDSWLQLTTGISQMPSCSVYKLGEKLIRHHCSGMSWASVSWCWATVFHLAHLGLWDFIYLCYFSFHYNYYYAFWIKMVSSQSTSFITFILPTLSSIPPMGGKWVSGCMVLHCQLELNQDTCTPAYNRIQNKALSRFLNFVVLIVPTLQNPRVKQSPW